MKQCFISKGWCVNEIREGDNNANGVEKNEKMKNVVVVIEKFWLGL